MASTITVAAARGPELHAAFRLMYQHLPPDDREDCAARSLHLVEQGDLQPEDVLVIRGPAGLRGPMVCCSGAGACGQIWPPQVREGEDRRALEDALIQQGLAFLRAQGARFVQCLLPAEDAPLAPALTRNGFLQPTALVLLRHPLLSGAESPPDPRPTPPLTCKTYEESSADLFAATLVRTYEGTLDFPELNGLRTTQEIMAGHKRHGLFNPEKWFLILKEGRAAGLLMLTEISEGQEWELAYLGVVPEARGQGIGRALVRKALQEAQALAAAQLTVSVDRRNAIARDLYQQEGFELFDVRDVYLILWPGPPAGPGS